MKTIIGIAIDHDHVDLFESALSKRSLEKISATIKSTTDTSVHYAIEVKQGHEDELFELGYRYGFNKAIQ